MSLDVNYILKCSTAMELDFFYKLLFSVFWLENDTIIIDLDDHNWIHYHLEFGYQGSLVSVSAEAGHDLPRLQGNSHSHCGFQYLNLQWLADLGNSQQVLDHGLDFIWNLNPNHALNNIVGDKQGKSKE